MSADSFGAPNMDDKAGLTIATAVGDMQASA
jgi:hypothetical protein